MFTILVCDDDKAIVEAIAIFLKEEGYRVLPCYGGEEALRLIQSETVHLALLDIMMPGLDGLHTARKMRQLSSLPILFLTAKSEDTDKIIGLNAGADDYITKPFNPLELMARVKSNLRRYVSLGNLPSVHTISTLSLIHI